MAQIKIEAKNYPKHFAMSRLPLPGNNGIKIEPIEEMELALVESHGSFPKDDLNLNENDFSPKDLNLLVDEQELRRHNWDENARKTTDKYKMINGKLAKKKTKVALADFKEGNIRKNEIVQTDEPSQCLKTESGRLETKNTKNAKSSSNQTNAVNIAVKSGNKEKAAKTKHIAVSDRSQNSNLPNLQCESCSRSFCDPSNLRRHVNVVHHKIKKHECDACQKCFGQRSELKSHVKFCCAFQNYK